MEKPEAQRRQDLFHQADAVRERPLLFVALTACLFAIMAFGAAAFTGTTKSAGSIKALLSAEPIDLDPSAETPAGLVRPRPFDPAGLETFLLESDGLAAGDDQGAVTIAVEREDQDRVVISLSGLTDPESAIDGVNDRINDFIENLNLERAMQRETAFDWIKRSGAIWHSRVEDAKSAITLSPFDAGNGIPDDPVETERLLRLFMDATVEARANLQVQGTGTEVIENAKAEMAGLTSDMTRLTSAMTDLEIRHAAQFKQVNALKDAEKGLADYLEQSEILEASDSLLNRPAASVLSPATIEAEGASLGKTAVLWVAMLSLSLLLAFFGTMLAARFRQPATAMAGRHSDMFNNPNWPLPPGANRDLS